MKKIVEVKMDECLSSSIYDPSPHRFRPNEKSVSDRQVPIQYQCENCDYIISFKTEDFMKHTKSSFSNLKPDDFELIKTSELTGKISFLDFYCPKCKQATAIIFDGGMGGYCGYELRIQNVIVIKESEF